MSTALAADNLSRTFQRNGQTIKAVDGVSFSLAAGETLGIVGPSGSGKSSLARLLLRLIEPDAGQIRFQGRDFLALGGRELRRARRGLQMVFQDPLAAFNPRASVFGALSDPLRTHGIVPRGEHADTIATLLSDVGLAPELARRAIHELSGGQRQRVAIARAMATRPDVIVLDEAVSALDVTIRARILELLARLQRETGVSYIFISHDLAVVRVISHRIAVMRDGRIVETGESDAVLSNPSSAATRALIAAIPRLATTGAVS